MIKKLRLRFIISALISILIVLSATIAAINVSNYFKTENECKHSLNQIIEREHKTTQMMMGIGDYRDMTWMEENGKEQFFVAVFNNDGNLTYTDFRHIVTVSEDKGKELATQVYQGEKLQGSIGNLRYKKMHTVDSNEYMTMESTYVAFVDISERMHSFNNFLTSSIITAAVSFSVLALLIIVSSHFVFKTSEESYHKQKAFVTNASHELKTPLTIISTDIEILEMDYGKNEWTESIQDQVKRLTVMTNQLVTLSRLDENDLKNYPMTTISLSQVAKENAEAFLPTFQKRDLVFNYEISPNIRITANKNLINELFYIFMDNALKYTKEKGAIDLSLRKNNKNKVEIIFSNDIEDKEIDVNQLFERFYRSTSVNKKEGSGIGLSIAKEIINLHKGKVSASIEDNKIYFVITF